MPDGPAVVSTQGPEQQSSVLMGLPRLLGRTDTNKFIGSMISSGDTFSEEKQRCQEREGSEERELILRRVREEPPRKLGGGGATTVV